MPAHGGQSFHFKKIPGGLNIFFFFFENRHEASFYIKEQTQKKKFNFKFYKLLFWTLEKAQACACNIKNVRSLCTVRQNVL